MKKYCFWWVASNLPAVVWMSWLNAKGPVDPLVQALATNLALWLGWLIFIGGLKWASPKDKNEELPLRPH